MRVLGLLNFYEERPAWLSSCIAGMHRCGVTHIVAVDGAYFLLPDGSPRSGSEQAEAIRETCAGLDMGLTLHVPQTVWYGNEVEKRTFLFDLANTVAEPHEDWFWVMDADQLVTQPQDLPALLAETDLDCGETTYFERRTQGDPQATQFEWEDARGTTRNLYRAIPGLRVETNHYTYVTPDGRYLWGNRHDHEIEPALDVTALVFEHRTLLRDVARHKRQYAYYNRRDKLGIERGICARCETRTAIRSLPVDWEAHPEGFQAGWTEVCDECAVEVAREESARLKALGYDEAVHGPLQLTKGKLPA